MAKKYTCLCLAILLAMLCNTSIYAQQVSVSIPERGTHGLHDSEVVKEMLNKHLKSWKTHPAEASQILMAAYKKSEEIKFYRGAYIALTNLGYMHQHNGNHDSALYYMLKATPLSGKPENIKFSNIFYNNIALTYSSIGNYEKAMTYYYKAMEVVGRVKMKNGTDSVGLYNNIGILWARLEELDQALKTFRQAEAIVLRTKDTFQSAMTNLNIGEAFYRMKQLDSAEKYYLDVLSISDKHPVENYKSSAIISLGAVYREKKQFAKSKEYIAMGIALADTSAHTSAYERIYLQSEVAKFYISTRQFDTAKIILAKALANAYEMNHKELLEMLERLVATVYGSTGQYEEAYKHLQAYTEIKDSLFQKEKKRSLDAWINVMDAEKNKALLEQKLYITRQNANLQKKNVLVGGTILGSLLLLSISFAAMVHYRHKQVIQQALISQLQQTQEINQLKAQVRGEEQERQRIAHELHDNVASQLWAIRLNVDNIRQSPPLNGAFDKSLGSILQQLTDATQDLRKTAHNLMPDLLVEEGLATALASMCEKISNYTSLEVDFQEYGTVPRMDKEIELSLYRMAQELIQNVMKHARNATHLLVQLSCAGTMLNITVEDNGIGFKEKGKEEGIGLQQIRKRTQALKGHFDLQSIPGKGTTAYLEFDLQHLL